MADTPYNLLSRKKAAAFLGLGLSSFDTARKQAGFPNPVIILNASKWLQTDLESYIEASKGSESE